MSLTPAQKHQITDGWRTIRVTASEDQEAFVRAVLGYRVSPLPDGLTPKEATRIITAINQKMRNL